VCVLESQASSLPYSRSCPKSVDNRGVDFSSQVWISVSLLRVKVSVQTVIPAPRDAQVRVIESQVSFADGRFCPKSAAKCIYCSAQAGIACVCSESKPLYMLLAPRAPKV